MESVASPADALNTIYYVAEVNVGSLADPLNVLDQEHTISSNQPVHGFLSNYLTTFVLQLREEGLSYKDFTEILGDSVSPVIITTGGAARHGGNVEFARARYFDPTVTATALEGNPMTALLIILRIHVEKLLLLVNPLGEYKKYVESQDDPKPEPRQS